MTKDEVRAIVIETLKELVTGLLENHPERDADGDEWNNYVLNGEAFVNRIFRLSETSVDTAHITS